LTSWSRFRADPLRREWVPRFIRESQLSIAIRTAICKDGVAISTSVAGIVADSSPAAETTRPWPRPRVYGSIEPVP